MYVPAGSFKKGKLTNAINALCFNGCVYATFLFCYVVSLLKMQAPWRPITMILLVAICISFFVWQSVRLKKMYTDQKVSELEARYGSAIPSSVAKLIYWCIVIISIPVMLSAIPLIAGLKVKL